MTCPLLHRRTIVISVHNTSSNHGVIFLPWSVYTPAPQHLEIPQCDVTVYFPTVFTDTHTHTQRSVTVISLSWWCHRWRKNPLRYTGRFRSPGNTETQTLNVAVILPLSCRRKYHFPEESWTPSMPRRFLWRSGWWWWYGALVTLTIRFLGLKTSGHVLVVFFIYCIWNNTVSESRTSPGLSLDLACRTIVLTHTLFKLHSVPGMSV